MEWTKESAGCFNRDVPREHDNAPFPVHSRLLIFAGFVIGIFCLGACFWWMARFSEDINFLNYDPRAQWIVYPATPVGKTRAAVEFQGTFRRSFVLSETPHQA